ncbi:MAG: hypothetical protein HY364_04730 [Candidatus Aenigmarchaeota archaeon]|nr:hypothetical protein [Candidatus Aenigmarchaeota archaeon]
MEDNKQTSTKLQLSTTDELWNKVVLYKLERGLKNNNQAVEELILRGIKPLIESKEIMSEMEISADTLSEIAEFRKQIPVCEKRWLLPLVILRDGKSGAFYTECHIISEDFIKLSDPDAKMTPESEEANRANRELESDNYYFEQMVEDAKEGRPFSDMVIEFYNKDGGSKPLKILGGQHRYEAIKEALKGKINAIHQLKVYFNLDKIQREDVMRIANTNINVAPDLRDRLREEILPPNLKKFAQETGILKKDENFGDKRRYDDEFSPTVRMVRSFVVNFFRGREYKGDIDRDSEIPFLCKSGRDIDSEYMKYFNKFKSSGGFNDAELIEAGKMFTKLHDMQFKNADKMKGTAKKEFKIKAFNLALITSWAFSAGVLRRFPDRLKKLYALPDLCNGDDPLNASAMAKASHKSLDKESYRGLGVRNDEKERGRLLHLFLGYSNSSKPKITEEMCNSAIAIFHSNQDSKRAEESRKRAF